MWPAIRLAAARRARASGVLSVNKLLHLTSRVPQLRATTPAIHPVSVSLVSRRGFAAAKAPADKKTKAASTTKKTTATKKKTAAKPKKAAPKKKPKAKKVLSPEEKKKLDVKRDKKLALLTGQPAKLPASPRGVYIVEVFKAVKSEGAPWTRALVNETFVKAVREYKIISESERERLERVASQNRLANEAAFKSWLESYTPSEVHIANQARRRLGKPFLKDARLPTLPLTSYALFVKAKFAKEGYTKETGHQAMAVMKQLGEEWKALSDAERQPYLEAGQAESERYDRDFREAFGRAPARSKAAASSSD